MWVRGDGEGGWNPWWNVLDCCDLLAECHRKSIILILRSNDVTLAFIQYSCLNDTVRRIKYVILTVCGLLYSYHILLFISFRKIE